MGDLDIGLIFEKKTIIKNKLIIRAAHLPFIFNKSSGMFLIKKHW